MLGKETVAVLCRRDSAPHRWCAQVRRPETSFLAPWQFLCQGLRAFWGQLNRLSLHVGVTLNLLLISVLNSLFQCCVLPSLAQQAVAWETGTRVPIMYQCTSTS